MDIKQEILDSLEGKVRCIECRKLFCSENKTAKWCSFECKGKTFDECFRKSQWVYQIENKIKHKLMLKYRVKL